MWVLIGACVIAICAIILVKESNKNLEREYNLKKKGNKKK